MDNPVCRIEFYVFRCIYSGSMKCVQISPDAVIIKKLLSIVYLS